ncbi:MAG: response regulator transcription factor [Caldilineaceae bacterium]|nr:response regulator transcription factor [Caldilineaceae bacterium]MCB0142152.1 response regulator transcription factor [Caldilineaceae bacterium]
MEDLIRILIADDHFVVRQGLSSLLVARNGMKVVAEAATGREAIDLARMHQPDVIIMDMMMPEVDGTQAISCIRKENARAKILVLTSFGEDRQVSDAIKAGALGYLLKDSSPDDLFHAIRNVHRGKMVLSQDMAVKLVQSSPTHSELEQLTEREFDVLKLVAQGQTNAEIAESLSIGVTTVRTHVGRLLSKLGYSNRTQLALFAAEQNLHSPL